MVSWAIGGDIMHNGVTPGYLYSVAEKVAPDDAHPHPHPANFDYWEWLTNRELELIEETVVTARERLTDEQIGDLRRKQREKGEESFVEWSG